MKFVCGLVLRGTIKCLLSTGFGEPTGESMELAVEEAGITYFPGLLYLRFVLSAGAEPTKGPSRTSTLSFYFLTFPSKLF